MSNLYSDLIIDHYRNPRNFGELKKPDGVAKEANASCGDLVEFQIKLKKEPFLDSQERFLIDKIVWRGVGCAISTAAASLLSEKVLGLKSDGRSILQMKEKDMVELLGGEIIPARIKCATLPLFALQKAVRKL